jgi:hypothetical protein
MKRNRLLRAATAGLLLVGVVAVEVAIAGPAAAVAPVTIVEASSAMNSVSSKSATAYCPDGTHVLGGGAGNGGGDGRVHLTRLQALSNVEGFTASSAEHGAFGEEWRLDVWAICGNLAGLEYVSFSVGANSDGYKSAVAECTGNKVLISAGGRTTGGDGQVILDDLTPSLVSHQVTVTAYEHEDGYDGDWGLYAYGVCASPIATLEVNSASGTPIDNVNDIIWAECSGNKQLVGLGGQINGGTGRVIYSGLVPTSGTAYVFAQRLQPDNYNGNWHSRVYAICA